MHQKNIQINLDGNKLEPRQIEIYNGLKNIGEEIAAFYHDGIKISNSNELETKANLLAHIAREIDGGLRDVLSQKKEEEKIKKEIRRKDLGNLGDCKGHVASILAALALDPDGLSFPIAKEWADIATKFAGIAHRHGAWKTPKDPSEIEDLWKEYEYILFWLVGTYYDLLDRVDRILQYEKPSKEILGALSNLLKVDARYFYFFRNLQSPYWLKPLKEKGYFNPENNPKPQEVPDQPDSYIIPYWRVLDYLKKVADENMKEPSDEITDTLIEIVNSIINYIDENSKRIENFRTDWIMLKIISTFPAEQIEKQHIEFVRIALKSKWNTTLVAAEIGKTFFSRLLQNKAKDLVLSLLDVLFEYKKRKDTSGYEYKSIMDEYWLADALKKHKPEIAKLCGIQAADFALNKIKSILKEDKKQFNEIWIPTIEDRPQNTLEDHLQNTFPDRYEYQLVSFVRDMFKLSDADKIRERIEKLLKEEHPIFRRIAIYTINHHYKDLNNLFWEWTGNPLDEDLLKHEIYELLKSNCLSLSEGQIEKVLEWIESADYYISDEIKSNEEQSEKVKAYRKREWLSALLETNNPKVIEEYQKYEKVNPAPLEYPGFVFYTETMAGYISPVEPEELCTKSNMEIAEYLNNFEEEIGWKKPSKEGLSDVFKRCVSNNPEKFSRDLELFQNVHRRYQNSLLRGLWKGWRGKKEFEWNEIFDFMLKIIRPVSFWKEESVMEGKNPVTSAIAETGYYNYRNWIISTIADLIEEGTKDDNHAFDPKLLPQAKKILLILVEKTESDLSEIGDPVTSALNSPKGKIFTAMVNYSLRYARLYRKDRDDRWVEPIKKDFEKRLDREIEPSPVFSVILGEYLANLYYLDKKWVVDNINKIFPQNNDVHWKASFTGYLFYSRVYKVIYFLLRENGHYAKALETDFQDEKITKQIVQHICIGYIEDWEKLDDKDSLIFKLIENEDVTQLSEIVSLFWMPRNQLTERIKAKIKPLWKALFEIVSQNVDKPEYQKIISNLSKWLSLIDEIDDEILEWLKVSAKYIKYRTTSSFVEYLHNHVDKTPEKVGKIFLEMLNSGVYPDFEEENIKGIVQILYEKGQKEIADRICNIYGEKGYIFLRELYEKYKGDKV